jgi:3-dehydroquinate dehydratase/shikimate dehydrogenase
MGLSLLCETVTGTTTTELARARDEATAGDMVELRLDGVTNIDVAAALDGRKTPVIVTCRPGWEGGAFLGSEEERCWILTHALELGADYVDVEWRALQTDQNGFARLVRRHPGRVIVSSHDFTGVPPDLEARARAMRATGAAVIKVAVMAARLSDTLPLREIARGGNAVVIGMGDAGVPTRLLASRFGSRWTYGGNGVAPGQIPARRMVDRYRFREVGGDTALYGVVGDNVMHSISPAMHNAAFAADGVDAVYVPLRAADFDDFLTFAAALGIAGASVTIPFKVHALSAAVSGDALTRAVGAANTLRRRKDRAWEATNTDVAGFLEPLEAAGIGCTGLRVSVLGAGGSARAVVVALVSRGASVTVHARRETEARRVAESLGARSGGWPPAPGSWDVLVNCTPLGSAAAREASPLPGGPFTGRLVYDLTYGPSESPLLRDARLAGCRTLDGLPMLVAQAERQFEWWTGARPRADVMRAAAEQEVGPAAFTSASHGGTAARSHGVKR